MRGLVGKTVSWAGYDLIQGYGWLTLEFEDGTTLVVKEVSQTGEIVVRIDQELIKPIED